MEKLTIEDVRSRRVIQRDSAFSGDSPGEYLSLAAPANVMPAESVLFVAFHHVLTNLCWWQSSIILRDEASTLWLLSIRVVPLEPQ